MMRIGIMLRSIDETGGIGVYARNITEELLKIDGRNEYVLYYRTPKHFGRFAKYPNATEKMIRVSSTLLWDQIAIPIATHRDDIDLIFHPKFTVPFLTRAGTVMVVHGASWFIPPYHKVFNRIDTLYIRQVMPLYFRKSDFVISVSDFTTGGFVNAMPEFRDKIKTIYFAPNQHFRRVEDQAFLEKTRAKYDLPDRYLLTVIRYDKGRKKLRKNFGNMVKGFALCRQRHAIPQKLIVVGKNCDRFAQDYDLASLGVEQDVVFTGYVEQEELPALYTMADLYLYPTVIEAFPIPITEAMACGCPIVTSRGTGLEELADDAAVLVDPYNPDEICDGIRRVVNDQGLARRLAERGSERSKIFSWEKCARETLGVFESVLAGSRS